MRFHRTHHPTVTEAMNLYAAEMRRRKFKPTTYRRYERELERFAEHVGTQKKITKITPNDCRSFLDTMNDCEPSTIALENSIISRCFDYLVDTDVVPTSPMLKIKRPKVPPIRDRKRKRISGEEVAKMIEACETWPEKLCINTAAFTGSRRNALSLLRWRDVDLEQGTIAFFEKGHKAITKPIADELRKVYVAYLGTHTVSPDDWVIPNRRKVNRPTRSNKFIHLMIREVGERCGVDAHVHCFRAAFAVRFLETNPGEIETLKELLGHDSIGTTQGYLDELNAMKSMRKVVTLSFTNMSEEDLAGNA